MKKNLYGNIEDMVVNVVIVTAQGTMQKTCAVPRMSMGPDMTQLVLGSDLYIVSIVSIVCIVSID